jgi:hypothetical protein
MIILVKFFSHALEVPVGTKGIERLKYPQIDPSFGHANAFESHFPVVVFDL